MQTDFDVKWTKSKWVHNVNCGACDNKSLKSIFRGILLVSAQSTAPMSSNDRWIFMNLSIETINITLDR